MKKLRIDAAGISDVGTVKKVNQDAFLYRVASVGEQSVAVFAVADGVGGLEKGEEASSSAIQDIHQWWEKVFPLCYTSSTKLQESIAKLFEDINTNIWFSSQNENLKTGTTLSMLVICNNQYYINHVGDSRIYKIIEKNRNNIVLLSKDHSCVVPKQTDAGTVYKSMLTECLGYRKKFNKFSSKGRLKKDEWFFVCSDGITKTISQDAIYDVLAAFGGHPMLVCQELICQAKTNGEKDNITAILAKVYV